MKLQVLQKELIDLLKKSVNSLTVLGLYAGTPIDSDNLHQFIGGLSNENIDAALSPVSIAWVSSVSKVVIRNITKKLFDSVQEVMSQKSKPHSKG